MFVRISRPRYDTIFDQYTRLFMPFLFIGSSILMVYSYFEDQLNCMVSSRLTGIAEFIKETCWSQGLYIYEEMHNKLNESSYYGIPEYTGYDGITSKGKFELFLLMKVYSIINRLYVVYTF